MDSGSNEQQTTVSEEPIHTAGDIVEDCTAIFRLAFSTSRQVATVFVSLYPHTGELIVTAHLGKWESGAEPDLSLICSTEPRIRGYSMPTARAVRETLESWLRTAAALAAKGEV